jgi:hypothetical protein
VNRREFGRALGGIALATTVAPARLVADVPSLAVPADRRWSFTADVAECCSCDIPCSCNFGRPEQTCHGNRLIQIRQGDFEGADLAGINFLVTFYMGQWTRIYVDDSLSSAQLDAFDRFLPVGFAGFDRLARAKERVPLTIESTPEALRFSVPASRVEMTLLKGIDGGPIRINGLPSNAYYEYVQYESVWHEHTGPDADWSYSGTNGFRSVMRAAG